MNMVLMEHLTSGEYLLKEDTHQQRILQDVNLLMKRGEAWAVSGRTSIEVKLLLEIMANIRPYDTGRCVLAERGMMRRKRVILHHVFYIGSADMLYDTMNVLEYVMFAVRPIKKGGIFVQEELFEALIDLGLGHVSLTPIRLLTNEERAVVTLAVAGLSDSLLIVFNLPNDTFDEVLTGAIGKITARIRKDGKTLVIGTNSDRLAEAACTHAAYLADGQVIYQGTVEDLRHHYDPVELIVRGGNLDLLAQRLLPKLPGYALELKESCLLILNRTGRKDAEGLIHEKILETGIIPESMELNPGTIRGAYEELLRLHDIQIKLLQEGTASGVHSG
jgi:ABC-2 type transport system ATP-binding protein